MQASLTYSFNNMRINSRQPSPLSFKSSVAEVKVNVTAPRRAVKTAAFVVEAKQNSLRRQRVAETARVYNKARKSEIATRIKKVFIALDEFKNSPPTSEADLAPVGSLLAEAYQVIDKAVVKGVLHANTAARRKARLARARRNVLIAAGLYTPQQ